MYYKDALDSNGDLPSNKNIINFAIFALHTLLVVYFKGKKFEINARIRTLGADFFFFILFYFK